MTNVLVPTDFTAASLKAVENALKNGNLGKCNLLLFHAFSLPVSGIDLLTRTQKDPATELMNEPFRQACKQLKDRYPARIGKILLRCMQGDTRAVFRNFAEANDVDLICCPDDFAFVPAHNRSVDPLYLFKKSGIPVLKTERKQASVEEPVPAFRNFTLSTS